MNSNSAVIKDPPQVESMEYWDAEKIRQSRALNGEVVSISKIIEEDRVKKLCEQVNIPGSAKIEKERERLEKERSALEVAEAVRTDLVIQWESKLKHRQSLMQEIGFAQGQLSECDQEASRLDFLHQQFGSPFAPCGSPVQLFDIGAKIAGLRIVREEFQKWMEKKEAAFRLINTSIYDFAKENGIRTDDSKN
jgi:hypothetical protein